MAEGEVRILSLSGCMGNAEFCEVDKVLARLREQKLRRVILDLTTLSFTTSVSLARFLVCGREFRRHAGELKLAGLSSWLSGLAKMAGFTKRDFEPDVATAWQQMAQVPKVKPRGSPKRK